MRLNRFVYAALLAMSLGACSPQFNPRGPDIQTAQMRDDAFWVEDGARLPYRTWPAQNEAPRAILLALHGFNDHSRAWEKPAENWVQRGITTYAYDQRGFGRSPHPGLWPGNDALIADVASIHKLVRARHPDLPIFVTGESMGGAVVMAALQRGSIPTTPGVILVAPAVRGRKALSWLERGGLWLLYATLPGFAPRVEVQGLMPSDNIPMLREFSRDPLVLKRTRVDALKGLIDLMDESTASAPALGGPLLILTGANDKLIPDTAMEAMLARLPPAPPADHTIKLYRQGFHMLLRDLQGGRVQDDVAAWILARTPQP